MLSEKRQICGVCRSVGHMDEVESLLSVCNKGHLEFREMDEGKLL